MSVINPARSIFLTTSERDCGENSSKYLSIIWVVALTFQRRLMSCWPRTQSEVAWWSMMHTGTPAGSSTPTCPGAAASTMMRPPIAAGHDVCSDAIFRNGAWSCSTTLFAVLPKWTPHAIKLGCDDARAMADPTVSMSPFFPVNTGTGPRSHAALSHS